MSGRKKFVSAVVLSSMLSFSAFAAEDTPLNASARAAIVQTLVTKMNANYIEPAVAERVGSAIARKNTEGGYASGRQREGVQRGAGEGLA